MPRNIRPYRRRRPLLSASRNGIWGTCRRIERDWVASLFRSARPAPLAEVLEAFCRHLQRTRTRKSWKNEISRLRVFFGPICPALLPGAPGTAKGQEANRTAMDRHAGSHVQAQALEDITAQKINCFLAARVDKDGWSAKTANLTRQALHQLFSYAIKYLGFRSGDPRYPNPVEAVDRLREPAPQIRFLTLTQIDGQLRILREHPVLHAMVATYIYAGLRREEAIWLTHDDVDLDRRLLRIRAKTIEGQGWQPKTKRNRVVPTSRALHSLLQAYAPREGCVWYFPSPAGKRWHPDNFSQKLRKINGSHGFGWSCLDFRHTFGSQLAQKGESLYKIATLMGNSPAICRRHYAALIPEEMADVVEFRASPDSRSRRGAE